MSTEDTPASRREALLAKREQLRAQQAQRMAAQRHADDLAAFERQLGAALAQAGTQYELLWDAGERRGPLSRYPIGFASVRWDKVPHAVGAHGATDDGQAALVERALRALAVAPASTVIVDWCRDGLPRVALPAADASRHARALLRHSCDTWIYAEDAQWLVEVYHEGQVTYADRPGAAEDAGDGWRRR